MGLIYTNITLINPRNTSISSIKTQALVDTGAITLCISQQIADDLKLEKLEDREVLTADGQKKIVPYVGPIQIKFENRNCFSGALIMGDSVLLGAIPMEDMDLVISPSRQTISVNPLSPSIATAIVKVTKK